MEFKLIRELGLEVCEEWPVRDFSYTFANGTKIVTPEPMVRATDLERVLSEGVRVYGAEPSATDRWTAREFPVSTHTGIIVGIKPLLEETSETAEDVLRDMLRLSGTGVSMDGILERARRALGE